MRLRAELQATGGNTTGFPVPDEFVTALGGGGRPTVTVTVKGRQWRGSIAKMGGAYWLGVSADRRAAAGISAGDVLDIEVALDTAAREVSVPPDLAAALDAEPAAKAFWEGLSYSNKSWHTLQITGAKTDETRARRVAKSVSMLAEGRAR